MKLQILYEISLFCGYSIFYCKYHPFIYMSVIWFYNYVRVVNRVKDLLSLHGLFLVNIKTRKNERD